MDASLTIRPSLLADLGAIDALLARSYPRLLAADYPPSVRVTALPLISRANPGLVASGDYFVVENDSGEVLAAGGCTLASPVGSAPRSGLVTAHIRHFVTDYRYQRQGLGRALMARAESHARALGADCLDCLSTRTAVGFYAAMGFRTLEPVTVELRPGIGFPAIRMQKRI